MQNNNHHQDTISVTLKLSAFLNVQPTCAASTTVFFSQLSSGISASDPSTGTSSDRSVASSSKYACTTSCTHSLDWYVNCRQHTHATPL